MNHQILVEQLLPNEANMICESASADMFLRGTLMQAATKNRNGRNYPLQEIKNAVTSLAEQIKNGNYCLGELEHPDGLSVSLKNASHAITEIAMDGNNAVGKLKLLKTPMGNIARAIVESGVRIGISSRGAGSVNEAGIVSGYSVVTCDLVATPSCVDAMLSISESLQSKTGNKVLTLAEAMQQDPKAQKYFAKEIKTFIDRMFTTK